LIYVCSLLEMPRHVRALRPDYVFSLVRDDEQPDTPPELLPDRHVRIAIDDISQPMDGCTLPAEDHVGELVERLRRAKPESRLLFHCVAGVSRSTAAALIALVLDADGREHEAARQLRLAAPHAHPNRRIIALADALLGREGRLIAAREAMGPGDIPAVGPLVELTRLV
jgi:predicted protein tyrosine phosphatase